MTTVSEIIKSELAKRTTEQLKNDVKAAQMSREEQSNTIFCIALSILEERLTAKEYNEFEESL